MPRFLVQGWDNDSDEWYETYVNAYNAVDAKRRAKKKWGRISGMTLYAYRESTKSKKRLRR